MSIENQIHSSENRPVFPDWMARAGLLITSPIVLSACGTSGEPGLGIRFLAGVVGGGMISSAFLPNRGKFIDNIGSWTLSLGLFGGVMAGSVVIGPEVGLLAAGGYILGKLQTGFQKFGNRSIERIESRFQK